MLTKTHRIMEPASGHLIGLTRHRGTAAGEVGDLASIITRFLGRVSANGSRGGS